MLELLLLDRVQDAVTARPYRCRTRHILEQRNLADHVAGLAHGQQDRPVARCLQNLQLAQLDDIGAIAAAALGEQLLTRRQADPIHHLAKPIQVVIRKIGEKRNLA